MAVKNVGVRYQSGGNSPSEGFDCSGLVRYSVIHSLGLNLPHKASDISKWGTAINRKQLAAGDLVFFNTRGRKFSHVGIYLGKQRFVHAPSTGKVVRVDSLRASYWNKRYNGARRLKST